MKKRDYRITGLLYLLVIIFAGLSQGYVRGTLVIPGDAAATAENILQNEGLFRMGITFDLIAFILDAVISVMLYQMLKPFGKTLAMVSSALRLIAHPAIGSLNLLNHFLAYKVLSGADFLGVFEAGQLESLSMLFMNAHNYGYLIAGAFFGAHLLLLGIQIYRSNTIPNIFGGFLLGSAAGYLLETFTDLGISGYEEYTALIVGIAAAIGELSLTVFLLVKGSRDARV
ncbi:MAG: hypothetical protein CMP59_06565 [Flavobacteriales bacterium]|nr:hypothetical protein [Flavobacteriales bacterium]|tara:strand:- start:595 stop:1278 length:684 start_codon:yes stop_codon:yes gene_type:complete